jgi:HlyD family secretion protein
MNKRWLIIPLFILAFFLTACQAQAPQTAQPQEVNPVTQEVVVQGRIEPVGSIDLAFAVNGRVEEVFFAQGQNVEKGAVLAVLSGNEAREADLARANQELAAAEQALKDLREAGKITKARNAVDVIDAGKNVDAAQETLDDLNDQFNPDEKEVAEAEARLALARVELEYAQDKQSESPDGLDADLLAAAQIRIKTAEMVLAAAEAARDALTLRAPMSGVLVDWKLQPGEFVSAGLPTGTLVDFSAWLVETDDLTELEVVRVFNGETARVILDALPDQQMSATVTHIAERYEEKRGDITYTVTLQIEDPVDALRWGMTGQILFMETR